MRKALTTFHEDPDTTVFLLSLGTAAAGLTLTRANHVYLLEPALDPAIEQQAIARVHRYGQERPVSIVRLLVQNTVEPVVLLHSESKQKLFEGTNTVRRFDFLFIFTGIAVTHLFVTFQLFLIAASHVPL
jgi:SNF2 family DNA or RNA helicase